MFSVIYKWKIKDGKEQDFRDNWKKATEVFYEKFGSLGSRLHKSEDGFFIAYAQWPDREKWQSDKEFSEVEQEYLKKMGECIEQSFDQILLNMTDDLLSNTQSLDK